MTRYEMETIINFNEEDDAATLCTFSKTMMRRLDALCEKSPTVIRVREFQGGCEYKLPKSLVTFRLPRQLSDEKRAEMILRMKKMRE